MPIEDSPMIRDLYCPSCGAQLNAYGGPMPSLICPRCYKAVLLASPPHEQPGAARLPVEVRAYCPNPRCAAPILANHPVASCLKCGGPLAGYVLGDP
jgi:ribosomal protein S27AE